ncbi:hypothetical protein [Pelagibius sp. Alg239-R121]|uniref:hypothetical protein n=1 Tax=Pelagibius sp. Alg239-R121 TaxID=2993448 RepID=UPI0024A75E7B|nr:hypothetical protein [Pelagibius sp. Alg239-R121]
MYLQLEDQKKYYYFHAFLLSMKDRVFHKKKVFDAYVKWSGLAPHDAALALRPNMNPKVSPANFPCERDPKTGKYRISVGMTWSKKVFGISRAVIGHYESAKLKAFHSANSGDKVKLAAWEEYLEATIMHEMVHWGRKVKGIEAPTYDEMENNAEAFEKEAYGKVTASPEPLCFQPETYKPAE